MTGDGDDLAAEFADRLERRGLDALALAQQARRTQGGPAHRYLDVACTHGRHDDCRLSCKFCDTRCVCPCHDGRVVP